ncbi:hypothetical protein HanRHA438_Chr08g0349201 [Helianthus annuus]|nr:hypothetical protein HanHA89_Chr08g0296481 [Helianthus annuus]KAJ0897758.1 hypothetical protein HanRHA438_Chr08g0349201 [Helianthus annuus]
MPLNILIRMIEDEHPIPVKYDGSSVSRPYLVVVMRNNRTPTAVTRILPLRTADDIHDQSFVVLLRLL